MTFHTQLNLELYSSPDEISPDGDIYIKQGSQQHKGNFAITALHSGKRIAVVPDLEMAKHIASMSSSYNLSQHGNDEFPVRNRAPGPVNVQLLWFAIPTW